MIFTAVWQVRSPLLVARAAHAGFESESLPHIPGSAWRGAAAAAYLEEPENSAVDNRFRQLFLDDQVRYCDLRPEGLDPWPLSVRRCKNHPDRDETVDALLASASGKLPKPDCSCGDKRGLPQGFLSPLDDGRYRTHTPHQQVRYHVQIDSSTRRARTGQLFATRTLNAGQRVIGRVAVTEEALPDVQALLANGAELWVGSGRSRGQGRLVLEQLLPQPREDLAARINALNQNPLAGPDRIWFSVTFMSPAILLDEWLLYRSYLLAADLGLPEYSLAGWFARTVRLSGWHAAAGLPKPEAIAVAAGSAFLFSRAAEGLDRGLEYARLAAALAPLEEWGVGERCMEGFGEAVVCHELHGMTPGAGGME